MEAKDIVLSCRVRLARNAKGHRFSPTQAPEDAAQLIRSVEKALPGDYESVHMAQLSKLARLGFVERHLISSELTEKEGGALLINPDHTLAIMVNEEDHLRIQAILPALDLDRAYALCKEAEAQIALKLPFCFDAQLGYLTACPTNLGTGLRASAMLHLVGLAFTGHLIPLLRNIAKLGVAVRGFYGEGSDAPGNIYQLSNQFTLGHSEETLLTGVNDVASQLIRQERMAREALIKQKPTLLSDIVGRSFGLCRYAHQMRFQEFMRHISILKLGSSLGLIDCPMELLDGLIVSCQSAQLGLEQGHALTQEEDSQFRAQTLRAALKEI
jgi:protein arginine kinase